MAAAHTSAAPKITAALKSAAAKIHAFVAVSDATQSQAAAAAALAAAIKRHPAVQDQLTRDKAAVAKAAAALAAAAEGADEEVIGVVDLVNDDGGVVDGYRLRASPNTEGDKDSRGDDKFIAFKGIEDTGDGDNGDGDKVEGDRSDGVKVVGEKGDSDHWDVHEGDGHQQEDATATLVAAPRWRSARAAAAMRNKNATWKERRRTSEMFRNVDMALRRVSTAVDGSPATASSPRASSAAAATNGNSAVAAAPQATSAAGASNCNADSAVALSTLGRAGHGAAAPYTAGAAYMSATATPTCEAANADASNDLEDVDSLRVNTGVAYEDDTLYLGTPSPPASRRQRLRSCSSGRRPPLPPRQTASSSSESNSDPDADVTF